MCTYLQHVQHDATYDAHRLGHLRPGDAALKVIVVPAEEVVCVDGGGGGGVSAARGNIRLLYLIDQIAMLIRAGGGGGCLPVVVRQHNYGMPVMRVTPSTLDRVWQWLAADADGRKRLSCLAAR